MSDEEKRLLVAFKYWRRGGNSFTCKLWDLMQSADWHNIVRFARAFPGETEMFLKWKNYPTEEQFFRSYGQQEEEITQ